VTLAELQRFLIDRLRAPLPGPDAQRRFAPFPQRLGWEPEERPPGARHAAALLLVYPGAEGPTIPLTVRHGDLPHHPGQVSLPGGRLDADEQPERAALREAHEEIGVEVERVRVLGSLSTLWVAASNHIVWPFVGTMEERPTFRLAAREVETLVEVPVCDVRDATRVKLERRTRDGAPVDVPVFDLGGQQVWGATAMILGEFGALFDPQFGTRSG
jgi:8-oxo-dGTP pyrophosphatase MutT (NUDIX family)